MLCDCQLSDTMTRRNYVISSIRKDMKESLQNAKVDLMETAHSVQSFSKINIDNIRYIIGFRNKNYEIIKTSRAGSPQPVLILPCFNQNPALSPARTLQYYLDVEYTARGLPKVCLSVWKDYTAVYPARRLIAGSAAR